MFITRKSFIKFYYKVVQVSRFYSTNNDNVSLNLVPIISYLNADSEKDVAIKQNKSKSGIYRWTNKVNNKIYIGSSVDLSRRLKEYYNYNYISKKTRNFPIHNALLKYGYSSFKLEILEYCDKSKLIECEQYYLDLLKPEYNVLTNAGSNLGFKHTEATIELFRFARLGHKRGKYLKTSYIEELTRNIDKKRIFSEATRLKLSANNHKSISVILRNSETGITTKFPSQSKAAQFLGVSETTVRKFIKQQRACKGYTITIE